MTSDSNPRAQSGLSSVTEHSHRNPSCLPVCPQTLSLCPSRKDPFYQRVPTCAWVSPLCLLDHQLSLALKHRTGQRRKRTFPGPAPTSGCPISRLLAPATLQKAVCTLVSTPHLLLTPLHTLSASRPSPGQRGSHGAQPHRHCPGATSASFNTGPPAPSPPQSMPSPSGVLEPHSALLGPDGQCCLCLDIALWHLKLSSPNPGTSSSPFPQTAPLAGLWVSDATVPVAQT